MNIVPLKTCVFCHEEKTLDCFYRSKDTKSGLTGRCKTCHALTSHLSRGPRVQRPTVEERFESRYSVVGECWEWVGAGYGFWHDGRNDSARRYSYVRAGKSIPRDCKIVGTCGNDRCVNPLHLDIKPKGNSTRFGFKICSDCRLEKALTEFSPVRGGSGGRFNYCKACFRARKRREHVADPTRAQHWKLAKYGMTLQSFTRMVESQGGLCAICGEPPGIKGLGVDHAHDSGTVRGLLCGRCNAGIAMFLDDPSRLLRAIDYLLKWNGVIAGMAQQLPLDATSGDEATAPRRIFETAEPYSLTGPEVLEDATENA